MGILDFIVWILAIVSLAIILCCFFCFTKWKIAQIFELDAKFETYHQDGKLKQKTRSRSAWDYSPWPGISKILHMREWLAPLVMIMFLVILIIYLKTNDQLVAELLKYNFGAFLGTMAQGVVGKTS